jgi:anti-sigma factor RsiW
MDDKELSTLIRHRATRHLASNPLRARVRTQVALEIARREIHQTSRPRQWRNLSWLKLSGAWGGALAGAAGGFALTLAIGMAVPVFVMQTSLPEQLVTDHVRALKTGRLLDVASSDRHTVKPWFQGKLDYAPPVLDLAADGFPLLGGRIELVAGARVAALAYASNKHILNVFVWPMDEKRVIGEPGSAQLLSASAPSLVQRNGFNLLRWGDGAMQVWVVSDLEVAELQRFCQAWRAQAASR